MLIWVDGWQMQCCGDPFAVGADVEWNLCEVTDRGWFDDVLGPDLSAEVTHAEDHHDTARGGTRLVTGRVQRIRAVSSAFGPPPGEADAKILVPTPGTARMSDLEDADGWFPEDGELVFNGYLVDLELG